MVAVSLKKKKEKKSLKKASKFYKKAKDYGLTALKRNHDFKKVFSGHVDDFKRGAPKAPSSVFTTTFAGIPKEVLEKGLFIFGLGRTIIKPSIFSFAILIAGAWLAGKKYIETG